MTIQSHGRHPLHPLQAEQVLHLFHICPLVLVLALVLLGGQTIRPEIRIHIPHLAARLTGPQAFLEHALFLSHRVCLQPKKKEEKKKSPARDIS